MSENHGTATQPDRGQEDLADQFDGQRDAKPWLEALKQAQDVFEPWNEMCDNIDRLYANVEKLKDEDGASSSQMAIFWANLQTLGPAIYSKPPKPVVSPAFRDRKPLPRAAAEVMERAQVTSIRKERMHRQMKYIRDDVARHSRGVMWPRLAVVSRAGREEQRLKYDRLHRRDFVHEPARIWDEVGWVAKRAWLSRKNLETRFTNREVTDQVKFEGGENSTPEEYTVEKKAEVWEIWSETEGLVIWVSPGCEEVLDIAVPALDLEEFYPCPEPAYGTLQPDSLLPVPDFAQYKDQIAQINEITARIDALTDAVKVRGFYPAGVEDIGAAVKKAMNTLDDRATMEGIPMPPGATGISGLIEWLPIDMIVQTIDALIQERRQLIEDVEQVVGISDIMRGVTEASETATAQQLKAQFGNVRVRDKTEEIARLAEDGLKVGAEIMAEHFSPEMIKALSQTDLPSMADLMQQQQALMAKAAELPQEQQGQLQEQLDELGKQIPFEAVMKLFRDERMRPFILEVRSDSTVRPNEDAEKQRRAELLTALGGFFQQALPIVQAQPKMAPFLGALLEFIIEPYRVDRQLQQTIDDLVEDLTAAASAAENAPPAPEVLKMQKEAEQKDRELDIKEAESKAKIAKDQADAQKGPEAPQIDPLKVRELEMKDATERYRIDQQMQLEREKMENLADIEAGKVAKDISMADRAQAAQDGPLEQVFKLLAEMQQDIQALQAGPAEGAVN